jgi:CBS domain-containing protein
MKARDVMTAKVLSVTPNTSVKQIAWYLLEHQISAVPVIDDKGTLLGIVSEGDLQRRPETGTVKKRAWWLQLLASADDQAREYKKTHGLAAADVMTRNVAVVTENTDLADVAELLERRRIKRVPVVREGKVTGVVSRSNLLRAFALAPAAASTPRSDRELRETIEKKLRDSSWASTVFLNVAVENSAVEISGLVESKDQSDAVRVLVENVPGVRAVKNALAVYRFPMVA